MSCKKIITLLSLVFVLSGCEFISSVLHDDFVVAKVGNHKLYKSKVEKLIPAGLNPQDSLQMALQYINSWASDHVFQDIAEQQLSDAEKDVSEELESYRRSLLKYRYEQLYVAQRLSQSVPEEEINAYYEAHKADFVLDIPIAKARILRVSTESPHKEELKNLLISDEPAQLMLLDSLSYVLADKYIDYSEQWVNLVDMGRRIGVDYGTILSRLQRNYAEIDDESGRLYMIYFADYMRSGVQAPIEFCQESIKETLISMRRRQLILDLERDLLEQARQKNEFVIYEEE